MFQVLVILYFWLNLHLIKMEKEYNIKERWNMTDQRYISSLITQEAVNAKQTRDMLLVSGRRRPKFSYPVSIVVNVVTGKNSS